MQTFGRNAVQTVAPLRGAGKNVAKKSGQGLDFYRWIVVYFTLLSRCVGIGRRDRLKICCPQGRVGSSPTTGTKKEAPVRGFFFCGEPWDLKRARRGQSRSGEVFTHRAGRLLQRAPLVISAYDCVAFFRTRTPPGVRKLPAPRRSVF